MIVVWGTYFAIGVVPFVAVYRHPMYKVMFVLIDEVSDRSFIFQAHVERQDLSFGEFFSSLATLFLGLIRESDDAKRQ